MSDYLLPEVVTEILKRLPVESLLRFRCVCRDWCTLISSPNFISQQLSHSSASLSTPTLVRRYSKLHSKEIYTLFHDESFDLENSTRIGFPFHEKSKFYFRIVGICDGLLCLSDDLFGCKESIIVWNPSIKRAITLPSPRVVFDRSGPYMFALGFGFDSENNDYKVVRVAYLLPNHCHKFPPKVEVFSLSLNVWRRVKNNVQACIPEHFWSQAVLNGTVHWVAYTMIKKKNSKDDQNWLNSILRFDLHTEKFSEMGLPEVLANVGPTTLFATMIKKQVSLLYSNHFMRDSGFRNTRDVCAIWVMMDYGNSESWTPVCWVDLEVGLSKMLGVKRDGELVFSGGNGELVFYNSENKVVTPTGICGTKDSLFVDKFAESLVLLGKGRKAEISETDYEDEDEKVEEAENTAKMIKFMFITSTMMQFDA